jgi:hypothetical protein
MRMSCVKTFGFSRAFIFNFPQMNSINYPDKSPTYLVIIITETVLYGVLLGLWTKRNPTFYIYQPILVLLLIKLLNIGNLLASQVVRYVYPGAPIADAFYLLDILSEILYISLFYKLMWILSVKLI